jgi:hypothetical protein
MLTETPPPTPAVLAARQILDTLHPDRENPPPEAPVVAEDVDAAVAVALFPTAHKDRKAVPVSPLAEAATAAASFAALAVPTRAPEARATALVEARQQIAAATPRHVAISAAELDRLAAQEVDGAFWREQAARLTTAADQAEQAVDALADAVARSHAARRAPKDPASTAEVGLRDDERAIVAAASAFKDELLLATRTIEAMRQVERGQHAMVSAVEGLRAQLAITADTLDEDLLHFAEHGTAAEQRRADFLLSRRRPRVDGDNPGAAIRAHESIQARHAAIVDGRVPASIRRAEAAELAYLEELRAQVQNRVPLVRLAIRERANLEGLFAGAVRETADLARLRDEMAAAWAPIVARARAAARK